MKWQDENHKSDTSDRSAMWNFGGMIIAALIGAAAVVGADWIRAQGLFDKENDDHLICTTQSGEVGKLQMVPSTDAAPAGYRCVVQ